jgi:poly(3-hydroxybutyrate) depolymerase
MQSGGSPSPAGDVPLIVFHGDEDTTVAPINAEKLISSRLAVARARPGGVALREPTTTHGGESGRHRYSRSVYRDADGQVLAELWIVHGSAHAWSGGSPVGSYTDVEGPDASAQMLRFFLEHEGPVAVR